MGPSLCDALHLMMTESRKAASIVPDLRGSICLFVDMHSVIGLCHCASYFDQVRCILQKMSRL